MTFLTLSIHELLKMIFNEFVIIDKCYKVTQPIESYLLTDNDIVNLPIENNFNLAVVDHIDENKQNNNYNNLQWMSSKENTRKSQSKKILQKTLNGELIKIWGGFGHIQEELGLHKSNIQKCCAGIKYKTAYGYKWEYDNYNCNL